MPQIHCYIPENLAKRLREKARESHVSVSRYLAALVKREVGSQWPEDYFELFGKWEGEPLERPAQGDYEQRTGLD